MKKEKSWGATGSPLPPEKRDSVSRPCQQGETRLLSVTESSHSEKWEICFRLGLFSFLCDVLWLCWENVSPVQFLLSSPSSQFWGAEGAPSPWETGPALARSSPGPQEGQRWHRRPRRGVPNLSAALLGHPHLSSHPGFLISARFRFMDIPQVFQNSQTLLHSTEAAKS